jgi:hypothetical protein
VELYIHSPIRLHGVVLNSTQGFYIYIIINNILGSWDSTVGIGTGYELDDRGVGVRVPVG